MHPMLAKCPRIKHAPRARLSLAVAIPTEFVAPMLNVSVPSAIESKTCLNPHEPCKSHGRGAGFELVEV